MRKIQISGLISLARAKIPARKVICVSNNYKQAGAEFGQAQSQLRLRLWLKNC